jgi:hypothetical protein
MIEFKDLPIRETASIMKGQFEQVKLLYAQNPVLAGELAISMMEQALCLDYSCTDFTVQLVLKNYENLVEKKAEKYDARKNAAVEAQKDALRPIAELLLQGKTQIAIAKELGIPKSTINDRVKKIRSEFPELLQNPVNPDEYEKSEPDYMDSEKSGGSEIITGNPEKEADLLETVQNPENPENPDYVNVNVNVNDNVYVNETRVSSNEETLETISLSELNRMGASYKNVGGGVIEFSTGKKMKVIYDF